MAICLAELHCLGNFDRSLYEEHLFEIVLNLQQHFMWKYRFKMFLVLALATILFSAFGQFCRGLYEEYLVDTIFLKKNWVSKGGDAI